MAMSDSIADMLTRIRNASMAGKETVIVPNSNLKRDILKMFQEGGFIEKYEVKKGDPRNIYVNIAYRQGKPVIEKLEKVSKPGCRIYVKKNEIPQVLSGIGDVIISTSKGVMTGKQAKKEGVGGEVICKLY